MRKLLSAVAGATLVSAALTGCGVLTPGELYAMGNTYELTATWCHVQFVDASNGMFPEKCQDIRHGAEVTVQQELPAGTCIRLGRPRVAYPDLVRTIEYDVDVAGVSSSIPEYALSGRPGTGGVVRRTCNPGRAEAPARPNA